MFIILCGKEPAAQQGDAHCFQVAGFDDVVDAPVHVVFVCGLGLPLQPEKLFVIATEWNCAPGLGNRLDAWNGGEFVIELTEGSADRIRFCTHHGGRERKPKREHIVRIETRINAPQRRQTADGQSRADKQHDSQCHLGDHEYTLHAMAGSTDSPATLLERRRETKEKPRVKISTWVSSPTCSARGKAAGSTPSAARVPQPARSKPSPPPARAIRTLSVSNWRITRPWLAPSAARTANSRVRLGARANNKLAD